MNSEDSIDTLPWLSDDDWKRMGFLQLSILSSLLTQERYGLEIKDHLMLNGYEIRANQLYAALNSLQKSEIISSWKEERKGVNRKFYKITNKGKSFFVLYTLNFIALLQDLYPLENLITLSNLACEMIEPHITPKSIIFDFSIRYTDNQFHPIAMISEKLTFPKGHVYLLSQKEIYSKVLRNKIAHYGLGKIISIKKSTANHINLSESSVDLAICNFMLHYPHNDWMIPEMSRILKSGGVFFISNPLKLEEDKIKDIRYAMMIALRQLSPLIPEIGIDEKKTLSLLHENKLIVKEKKFLNGVLFLSGKKK